MRKRERGGDYSIDSNLPEDYFLPSLYRGKIVGFYLSFRDLSLAFSNMARSYVPTSCATIVDGCHAQNEENIGLHKCGRGKRSKLHGV